jgi:NAD-dependent dihydropyrimidine dehydrogenase PreA subunit
MHLRIEEAKQLLAEHPDWSNDNIALACGFSSRSYFQNVFRKQTGMTPAQFAKGIERSTSGRLLPQGRKNGRVASGEGKAKCKSCARVCPMQLTPYDSRGQEIGYLDPDCLKCGKCTLACPSKIMTLKN